MNKWIGLLAAAFVFMGIEAATAQGDEAEAPSLLVISKPLSATTRIIGLLPSGDDSTLVKGDPVTLKVGEQYTLFVTMPGYTPFTQSFTATWSGSREKSVALEKGLGPAEGEVWEADLEDMVLMEFMPIPAGEFMMGSNFGEEDERPVRRVEFRRPFWMAKTEVTNEQFTQYTQYLKLYKTVSEVEQNVRVKKVKKLEKNETVMPQGAVHPACYVSWNDAMKFCEWLTKKEQRRGRLPEGYEYTLPTEAEWEYACRAGTTEEYAGKLDSMGWSKENSSEKTNAVETKKPNAWGLHDMHGNVWEWCADEWYASYIDAPVNGSQRGDAPDEYDVDGSRIDEDGNTYRMHNSEYRAVRGGCWSYSAQACRSANRFYHKPDFELNYLGFRPVILWNPPVTQLKVTKRLEEEKE